MTQRSEDLAARFEKAVADLTSAIESCPDDRWNAVCEDPWTVAQVGPPIAKWLRTLTDEQLDRTFPLPLPDGAQGSTIQLLEGGVLIDHVGGGLLTSIKAAIA